MPHDILLGIGSISILIVLMNPCFENVRFPDMEITRSPHVRQGIK